MANKWTNDQFNVYKRQLHRLYVVQNKPIKEIADILKINQSSVFKRLNICGIKTQPRLKKGYLNIKQISIPKKYSADMAEFFGVLFGDGHVSHFQIVISLGSKELEYANYIKKLMDRIFKTKSNISFRKSGYKDVYIGSVLLTSWLFQQGVVKNKVKSQVDIPDWIFTKKLYMKRFLRGFFDTDGSVYRLKFGVQISFTNYSEPILKSLHKMLFKLEYKVSEVSSNKLYITKLEDVLRFFKEIKPKNIKHLNRFYNIVNASVV
jgi:DNA-binding transcriptional regulator WhiA